MLQWLYNVKLEVIVLFRKKHSTLGLQIKNFAEAFHFEQHI